MKGTTADRDKTRIGIKCMCGGFFQIHASWFPDDDLPNLVRNAMHCTGCNHQLCIEIIDHGATSVEIHSITPNSKDTNENNPTNN